MILLIGAGTIGAYAAQLFSARGSSIKIGARSVDKIQQKLGHIGAEIVHFDFDDVETFEPALRDIRKICFIAPHSDPQPSVSRLLSICKQRGVEKVVFSSGRTTGDVPGKPLYQVEQAVRTQDIPYVILRPGWFMQNFLGWIGSTIASEGAFYLPIDPASKTAFVDVRDIADVAWHVLQDDRMDGQTMALTSEEMLDHQEVADKLSQRIGKKIQFISLDPNSYIDKMTSHGWSMNAARHVIDLYDIVRSGKEAHISSEIRDILGRAPYDFDKFLQHHPVEVDRLHRVP